MQEKGSSLPQKKKKEKEKAGDPLYFWETKFSWKSPLFEITEHMSDHIWENVFEFNVVCFSNALKGSSRKEDGLLHRVGFSPKRAGLFYYI